MKNKVYLSLLALGLSWFAIAPMAEAAGDAEAGKKKFYTCVGCHAVESYTNAYPSYHVPRLGGQHPNYVVSSLKAYQASQRKHPSMLGNSVSLSEQDMQDIAAYVGKFRGLGVKLAITGDVAEGKRKAEACASCHGEDGNSTDGNFPRLAGQYESYLIKALEDYQSGARNNPMMAGFAASLSEEDIKNVAAYYASQKKGLTIPKD